MLRVLNSYPAAANQFVVYVGMGLKFSTLYFSTLSHKQHDLKKTVIDYKMCFDFIYNFCLKHFSL